MPRKMTQEEMIAWMVGKGLTDRYEILYFAPKGAEKSKFLDKKRNKEFEATLSEFKKSLTRFPNYEFGLTRKEIMLKARATTKERYGSEFALQNKEFLEKKNKTNLERYGVTSPLQNDKIKAKAAATNLKKYGVENVFANSDIKKKIVESNLERYGFARPAESEEIKKKIEKTNLERYGAASPLQSSGVKLKMMSANLKKCGYVNHSLAKATRVSGKTFRELAIEKSCSYSNIQQKYNKYGADFVLEYDKDTETGIEFKIRTFLESMQDTVGFIQEPDFNGKKPDFLVYSHKFIIECDGLIWHSEDNIPNRKHHKQRQSAFADLGYRSLFFREDEINDKFHIVQSIIKNKLGLNQKLYARKCKIQLLQNPNEFLTQNHLMGKGSGRGYALVHDNEVVAVMQVKWKKSESKQLEVSRFCTKNNLSVIGGFSKLLKHVINQEKPNSIITFIDKRYGDGSYLKEFGFEFKNNDISFQWTDGRLTFHRMRFRGNTGYDHGLHKIYDCGQAKWELTLA